MSAMYDDDSDNDHAICWREEPPYRRSGRDVLEQSPDGEVVRCAGCGHVDTAARVDEWDRECNYEQSTLICATCSSDLVTEVKGMPCQRCFHALAMANDDWCYSCAVAETLDDVAFVPRVQRAQEAAKALPSVSEFIGSMFRDLYGVRK